MSAAMKSKRREMDFAIEVFVRGHSVGKSRTYEFNVNPEQYTPGATKAAALANALVVDQLAALK